MAIVDNDNINRSKSNTVCLSIRNAAVKYCENATITRFPKRVSFNIDSMNLPDLGKRSAIIYEDVKIANGFKKGREVPRGAPPDQSTN
jgi:hypothetical protein